MRFLRAAFAIFGYNGRFGVGFGILTEWTEWKRIILVWLLLLETWSDGPESEGKES